MKRKNSDTPELSLLSWRIRILLYMIIVNLVYLAGILGLHKLSSPELGLILYLGLTITVIFLDGILILLAAKGQREPAFRHTFSLTHLILRK